MNSSTVIFYIPGFGWRQFKCPPEVVSTCQQAEVPEALETVEVAVQKGYHAVGFISYEAAPAFDTAMHVVSPDAGRRLPLVWFALFSEAPAFLSARPAANASCALSNWTPSVTKPEYLSHLATIKMLIAAGDTYQVNYTFRMRATVTGDPYALFCQMTPRDPSQLQLWLNTGRFSVSCASPELFLKREGTRLTARPMKGTIRRAPDFARDQRMAQTLADSTKDKAENVMIVDMIRNDLGRIAIPGTVSPSPLFTIERYPTLYQMTSTVTAESQCSFSQICRAMFPCASITGAPKIRTMQVIAAMENQPRGIYTGAIGILFPGGDFHLNVAIRTAVVDHENNSVEFGTGSGIVWDSEPDDEYQECLLKTALLSHEDPEFKLLETLLWTPQNGFFLIDRHLNRLAESMHYFGFPITSLESVRRTLIQEASTFQDMCDRRVRITLARDGHITVTHQRLSTLSAMPTPVCWAEAPIDPEFTFIYHKTTHRDHYDSAKRILPQVPPATDVLLWNHKQEITESTIANIVILKNGSLLTPPISSGLLGGTLRAELIDRNMITASPLTRRDVEKADAFWLINSVRGWRRGILLC